VTFTVVANVDEERVLKVYLLHGLTNSPKGGENPHKPLKNSAITAARIKVREVACLEKLPHCSVVT
jgi:hypothetical protein